MGKIATKPQGCKIFGLTLYTYVLAIAGLASVELLCMYVCIYVCVFVLYCWKENVARDLTLELWRSDWLNSTLSHHYVAVRPPVSLVQVLSGYLPLNSAITITFIFLFDWPRFPFHCFDLSVLWQCSLLHADNFDPGTWRTQLRSWKVMKIFISTAVCTLNFQLLYVPWIKLWLHGVKKWDLCYINWPYIEPSVIWHSWLCVRKSIRRLKIERWCVDAVICLERGADCLYMVQLMPLHPINPIISCLI